MNKTIINLTFASLLLYLGAFLTIFLIYKRVFVGKDGGLAFSVLSTCIFSALFFAILKKSIKHFFIGFFIGLLSYIIFEFGISHFILASVLYDHMIVTTIIFFCGVGYWTFLKEGAL